MNALHRRKLKAEFAKHFAEVRKENELNRINLVVPIAWCDLWREALYRKDIVTEAMLSEIEEAIRFEARLCWNERTLVFFNRKDFRIRFAHPDGRTKTFPHGK